MHWEQTGDMQRILSVMNLEFSVQDNNSYIKYYNFYINADVIAHSVDKAAT